MTRKEFIETLDKRLVEFSVKRDGQTGPQLKYDIMNPQWQAFMMAAQDVLDRQQGQIDELKEQVHGLIRAIS